MVSMSRTYGTASLVDGWWSITTEPHIVLRLKRHFGRVDLRQHGTVRIRSSDEVCRDLEWFCERYPLSIENPTELARGSGAHRDLEAVVGAVLAGDFVPRTFPLAVPLRSYQETAADLAHRVGGLLLADDTGVGKTASAIGMLSAPEARPAVVVCDTHVARQWKREVERFLPGARVVIAKQGTPYNLSPTARGKQAKLEDAGTGALPDVLILTYSKLSGWADALAPSLRSIVFDEIQSLRHTGTSKYAAAKHLAEACAIRLGLSATPIHNLGSEIWAVVEILRPGALGTFDEFKNEWCGQADMRGRAKVKDPRALGAYLREAGIMLRRTRRDVGRELPPLQKITVPIDADLAALNRLSEGTAELARIILQQGGAGFEKMRAAADFDMRLRQATGIAKAPAVADFVKMLLEGGEERVVLFGWHHEVYKIWEERLDAYNPVFFTGRETDAQKARSVERFTTGDARVLIMSTRSGAGLDGLQYVCRTTVTGELDWSPAVIHQNISRVDRDGQPDSVTAYILVSDSGSDPVIAGVLGVKEGQSEGIRNPSGEVLEEGQTDPDHVKRLAAAYLAQIGEKPPALPPVGQVGLSLDARVSA